MPFPPYQSNLPASPLIPPEIHEQLNRDYDTCVRKGLPDDWQDRIEVDYGLDLSSEYGGLSIRNPWGKGSGQLSMTARQVADDVAAGLGFVVLKTVIAEDAHGTQTMGAWAVREARMLAEPIVGRSGETGWTVSWKGRGWWQSFDEYLQLIRDARELAAGRKTQIALSCKYHLPTSAETTWRIEEYRHTTRQLWDAYHAGDKSAGPMAIEKDFSPTLAGSDRASQEQRILEWLTTVPGLIREAIPQPAGPQGIRVGLKLFNALFDDDFQLAMVLGTQAAADPADYFVYGNRLFDPSREFAGTTGIAYGGPDLSDRNLRVMARFQQEGAQVILPWSATGNITTGRMALEYALLGASSFQLHTFFQLPAEAYASRHGSHTARALIELNFHPREGLIAWMFHLAGQLRLSTRPLRFRDIVGRAHELSPPESASPVVF